MFLVVSQSYQLLSFLLQFTDCHVALFLWDDITALHLCRITEFFYNPLIVTCQMALLKLKLFSRSYSERRIELNKALFG